MKTFLQWVESKKLELPVFTDADNEGKPAVGENTKRSGISANYPDAYVRSQYPHKYFNPIASDADYKLSAKPRSGGSNTAK